MSTEKNIREASRWIKTAEDDLDSAEILKKNDKYAHACFHCQQSAEKAIKAVWYLCDADPWGHSIKKLIDDLEAVDTSLFKKFKPLLRPAMVLDRFYIPTRYPNGLPDMTPDEAFAPEDAKTCIKFAGDILAAARLLIK